MIYVSNDLRFIKLLATSKTFLILAWLNINFELLKIGCNQARYVGRGICLGWPPGKSCASLGDNKDKKHLCDQWHGMVSCKSTICCTVNQKTGCLGTSKQRVRNAYASRFP